MEQSTISNCLTEQEVFDICLSRVDYAGKLKAKTHTLCIDGTSCTMKSSILNATGRLITKVQRNHRIQNPNTFGPSMLGYICSGINTSLGTIPHFNDRSPLNVLEWHILWKLMDDYLESFGNTKPDENDPNMTVAFQMYRKIFNAHHNRCAVKVFSSRINGLAIVDSNTDRCDERRSKRNKTASDIERSTWNFYTFLQNLMYKELYDGLYIDLAWFLCTDPKVIVSGMAKFFNFVLDYITKTIKPEFAIVYRHALPTVRHDYNMSNMTVHAYRSIGRWGCKELSGTNEYLHARLPKYLDISNIVCPNGLMHEPIVPTTRAFMFIQSDQQCSQKIDEGINTEDNSNCDNDSEFDFLNENFLNSNDGSNTDEKAPFDSNNNDTCNNDIAKKFKIDNDTNVDCA